MEKSLPWNRIRSAFRNQWVELVDAEWEWGSPYPEAARVRHSAPDRSRLIDQIERSGKEPGSLVLFIGAVESVVSHESSAQAL